MSSYFDEASLVMIPSGYKDQKVYSVKPLDGSGDLTFSRASSATRVASNDLIEKVRTNLALRSQSFATSAVWSTVSGTITNNAGTAPDGTNTASKIVAGNSDPYVYQSLTPSGQVTLSCYVKGVGSSIGKIARILCASDFTDVTMDGTWQRIKVTHTASGSELYGLEVPNPAATSDEVLMWGFQVEAGDIATDYIATTTAAVSVGPVSGLPRLDYLNSTCPRLLLEPQRTNLALYSEQFNNSVWIKEPSNSATANTIASPDGYVNADTITAADGATINIYQSQTSASNTVHTFSAFLKKNNLSEVQLYMFSSGFVSRATVNFDNGTITDVVGSGSTITNYGNGWYRCSIQGTINSGVGFTTGFLSTASSGSKSVYAYGGQLEVGAYATSYIPTLGTSVTRVADVCSKSGISSILPTQTGTLYVEFDWQKTPADVPVLSIHNNSTGLAWIQKINSTTTQGTYFASGYIGSINGTVSASAGIVKVAYAWTNGRQALYINGVQAGTATAAITDSNDFSIFEFNGFWGIQNIGTSIASALVFPTALSNSDLAALTA